MDDVYYNPSKFGLTPVAEIQDGTLSYEFDILAVWKEDATGFLYYAQDNGCSCPSPFEDMRSLESLNKVVTQEDWNRFERAAREWNRDYRDKNKSESLPYFLKAAHDAWKCPYCGEVACENEKCFTIKSIARTVNYGQ